MPKKSDLTGNRFGRLSLKQRIVKKIGNRSRTFYLCECDCGNQVEVRADNLTNNGTVSCGCYNKELSSVVNSKDTSSGGKEFGEQRTKLREIWRWMKRRCFDTSHHAYKRYGGRGITVDESWLNFENFYQDMKGSYQEGLTLDRINVSENYSKENCKWSSNKEQSNNKENTRKVFYNGVEMPLAIIYDNYAIGGLKFSTFASRVSRGWDINQALKTKPQKRNQ